MTTFHFQGRGYSLVVNTKSTRFWPNFHGGGVGMGEGYSLVVKTQSAKFWPNFDFWGRGGSLLKNRVFLTKWSKNSGSLANQKF